MVSFWINIYRVQTKQISIKRRRRFQYIWSNREYMWFLLGIIGMKRFEAVTTVYLDYLNFPVAENINFLRYGTKK